MAEIINMFPSRDPNGEEPGTEQKEALPNDAEILLKAMQIKWFLGGLSGSVSRNSLAEAQIRAREYGNVQLATMIWKSDQNKWTSKPAHYLSIVDEFYRRMGGKKL